MMLLERNLVLKMEPSTAQTGMRKRTVQRTGLFNACMLQIEIQSNKKAFPPVKGKNSKSQHSEKVASDDRNVEEEVLIGSKNAHLLISKSYRKDSHEYAKHSDFENKESSLQLKKYDHDVQDKDRKYFDTNSESSGVINSNDEESEISIQFEKIENIRKIENFGGRNLKATIKNTVLESKSTKNEACKPVLIKKEALPIRNVASKSVPLKNEVHKSLLISNSNNKLPSFSFSCDEPKGDTQYYNDNAQIFISSTEENYIPPPVNYQPIKDYSDACNVHDSSSAASGSSYQNKSLESAVEAWTNSDGDETHFFEPDSELYEAISTYILAIVKERSVSNVLADKVVRDLNLLFKDHLEGNVIDVYGSYFSGLAISTSDINLVMIADSSVRKSFMCEVYKVLSKELEKYNVHPYEERASACEIKINFSHPDTGVNCELAYLGKRMEHFREMGKFLKRMCSHDKRVKTLIIATKIWSECLFINEVEEGKIHPIGYTLMVIHFLQHCEPPLLQIKDKEMESLPSNNSTIGELWLTFLKYYAVLFNWQKDVITVNSKEWVSKKSKDWKNYWIAIEDPFTHKNIAASVINSDVADYITLCFKSSYEYFCNPAENMFCTTSGEEQNNGGSPSPKWQFSFNQCIAEQSDNFCEDCDELGDICDECKKKIYVQPMSSVPQMTDSFLKLVKDSLNTVYRKYILTEDEVNARRQFVSKLQVDVQKVYPDAKLKLFGSSANGFGFKNSDLDICMTFKEKKIINTSSVLKDVRILLRRDRKFEHVIGIFNASVPILKFHFKPKGWRCDISLDNTLATYNSELLRTYSLLDERCKIIGCALKLLAKKALITEVTDKALSSYSYLNMAIHFLQQTNPPILPVLQDPKLRKDFSLDHIVENCSVWFCKDLNFIERVFQVENHTSVEQLWLDLLDYYCSFDCNQFITIRQKEPLYVNENKHSARLFNIQDPFIVTKNLGSVVSATKAQEMKSVLNRARQLFRTPVKELPASVKDIEDYFFSTMSLTGRIQEEAVCDLCGKFGHERKKCSHFYFFCLQRNNFRRFSNQYMHNNRNQQYRKSIHRQPNRKQL